MEGFTFCSLWAHFRFLCQCWWVSWLVESGLCLVSKEVRRIFFFLISIISMCGSRMVIRDGTCSNTMWQTYRDIHGHRQKQWKTTQNQAKCKKRWGAEWGPWGIYYYIIFQIAIQNKQMKENRHVYVWWEIYYINSVNIVCVVWWGWGSQGIPSCYLIF